MLIAKSPFPRGFKVLENLSYSLLNFSKSFVSDLPTPFEVSILVIPDSRPAYRSLVVLSNPSKAVLIFAVITIYLLLCPIFSPLNKKISIGPH
jgi:hypothetical protein